MLIIVDLVLIGQVLVTRLHNLPCLLGHVRLEPELQQPPGEAARQFVVLQLEEEVERCPEGNNVMSSAIISSETLRRGKLISCHLAVLTCQNNPLETVRSGQFCSDWAMGHGGWCSLVQAPW